MLSKILKDSTINPSAVKAFLNRIWEFKKEYFDQPKTRTKFSHKIYRAKSLKFSVQLFKNLRQIIMNILSTCINVNLFRWEEVRAIIKLYSRLRETRNTQRSQA